MTNTLEHLPQNSDDTALDQDREAILNGADEMRKEYNVFLGAIVINKLYTFDQYDPKDIINE